MNPIAQFAYLEPLDTYLNNQWAERFEQTQLRGKLSEQAVKVFGSIYEVFDLMPYEQDLIWYYRPLSNRIYWFASRFEVYVDSQGRVTGYQANDD